jgi:proteasome lid subunit RPN8/RPN11
MLKLPNQVYKDFEKHVLAEYPKEAAGLVINDIYVPCLNVHEEPTKHFRIAPEQMVLEQTMGRLQAILHSHPYSSNSVFTDGYRPEYPSASDIDHFNKTAVPWGIVSTAGKGLSDLVWLDDNNRPELYGRLFIWGTQDCYSFVRDWYWINRQINLPNVPREWCWWNKPEQHNFLEEHVMKAGFSLITTKEATIGDVALMRMGDERAAGVINHVAVITNHNEISHQGFGPFYSRACRQDLWAKSIAKYVRYTG